MSKQGTCWDGYVQKGMKKKGNKMVPNCVPAGMKEGGLTKWFNQKWVDIGSKKKGGGFKECGRKAASGSNRKYPKCVPAAKAASMTDSQRRSAVARKRAAGNPGGKPTNVATFAKKQCGGIIDTTKNKIIQENKMPRREGLRPIGDSVKKIIEKIRKEREERRNKNKSIRTQPKLPGMKDGGISRREEGKRRRPKMGIPSLPEKPRPQPKPGPGSPPRRKKDRKDLDKTKNQPNPNFGVEFDKDGPARPGKDITGYAVKKGGLIGGQKKLDANKDGKISGDDFKILRGKQNKMKGGGIAIRGTNFKGVY